MNKIKIGIIGCGGIARAAHIPSYLKIPEVELVACVDIVKEKAEETAKTFNIPHWYTDYREMLEKEDLDGVSICTPNIFHKEQAIESMKAGAHVLVEKPAATTLKDAYEMVQTAKKYNKVLVVGFQNRFNPKTLYLKKLVEEGVLGEIYYVKAKYLRRRGIPNWGVFIKKDLQGGGALIDVGVHVIDLALYLIGFPTPVSVTGKTYTKFGRNPEVAKRGGWKPEEFTVEDLAVGLVKFENGLTMLIEASWALNLRDNEVNVELYGTKAGVSYNPLEVYKEFNGVLVNESPIIMQKVNTQYMKVLKFIESIKTGKSLYTPGREILITQAIIEAIYKPSETGKEVEIPKDYLKV